MMTTNYNEKNDVDCAHVVGSVSGMSYKTSTAPEISDLMDAARYGFSAAMYNRRDKNGDPVLSAPKFMATDQMRMRELLEKAVEKTNRSATDIEDVLSRLIARGLKLQSFEVTKDGYRVEFK